MVETEVFARATSALSIKKDVNVTYTELDDFDHVSRRPTYHVSESAVQAWPTQPKPLVLAQREQALWTAFDIVLIALPICLMIKIGLCIYAYHLDRHYIGYEIDEVSLLSQGLVQLNEQLVTLFTIVFVTIMSTFVKRYALWKAQHGACVTDLEQLQGSVSLPSTLKLIWSLRSFGVNSMLLALAWSFYYLGSQAVKLEYRLSLSEDYSYIWAAIQRPDAPSYFSPNYHEAFQTPAYSEVEAPDKFSYLERLNTRFGAMILEDQDQYNSNVHGTQPNPGSRNGALIPDYYNAETFIPGKTLDDKFWNKVGGWLDVSKQVSNGAYRQYVSLTGQSLWVDSPYLDNGTWEHNPSDLPFLGTYTLYNISYMNVSCGTPTIDLISSFPKGTLPNTSTSLNMTTLNPNASRDGNGYPLRQFDYWFKGDTLEIPTGWDSTERIPETSNMNVTLRAIQRTCNITTRYVDMRVNCIQTGCYPNRLRWVNDTSESEATGYSTPFDDDVFAASFLSNLILSTGNQQDIESPTIVDQEFFSDYALNSTYWSTLGPAYLAYDYPSYEPACSNYLAQGFNTYYMLSQSVLSDYATPNFTGVSPVSPTSLSDNFYNFIPAHGAQESQGYRINWLWIPVDFMACSILLAAAIGAYWLRINTLAPDIFGYVSSLTRDNPHLNLPTEGSAMSGIDRARMLRGVQVKIADVQSGFSGDGSIGRVGLVPLNAEVRPLHSNARYV